MGCGASVGRHHADDITPSWDTCSSPSLVFGHTLRRSEGDESPRKPYDGSRVMARRRCIGSADGSEPNQSISPKSGLPNVSFSYDVSPVYARRRSVGDFAPVTAPVDAGATPPRRRRHSVGSWNAFGHPDSSQIKKLPRRRRSVADLDIAGGVSLESINEQIGQEGVQSPGTPVRRTKSGTSSLFVDSKAVAALHRRRNSESNLGRPSPPRSPSFSAEVGRNSESNLRRPSPRRSPSLSAEDGRLPPIQGRCELSTTVAGERADPRLRRKSLDGTSEHVHHHGSGDVSPNLGRRSSAGSLSSYGTQSSDHSYAVSASSDEGGGDVAQRSSEGWRWRLHRHSMIAEARQSGKFRKGEHTAEDEAKQYDVPLAGVGNYKSMGLLTSAMARSSVHRLVRSRSSTTPAADVHRRQEKHDLETPPTCQTVSSPSKKAAWTSTAFNHNRRRSNQY
eukprot:TRINITY_DN28382_c0_g1_i1.p1 TRINITY_DN28382_c0_g1~~TRINITY_DN28382_c0_g1_i1.p1  ORF type:complete len:449 (-),score=52.71 TRINITY_DN28382_c0_g1_i1:285-1631(-)